MEAFNTDDQILLKIPTLLSTKGLGFSKEGRSVLSIRTPLCLPPIVTELSSPVPNSYRIYWSRLNQE